MYGREACLPDDIVYGPNPLHCLQWILMLRNLANFWKNLLIECVNIYWLDIKSKNTYGKCVQGDPYEVGDTMIATVVDKHIKKVPPSLETSLYTRLLRRYLIVIIIIKSVTNQREQIVHFNRLKPCKPGTCFHKSRSLKLGLGSDVVSKLKITSLGLIGRAISHVAAGISSL